jgi:hypothetical protein
MRRWFVVMGSIALAFAVVSAAAGPSGAATAPKVVPGATYSSTGTNLVVDVGGTSVRVVSLPVHAKCKAGAPSNEGDYGATGLGPFPIKDDGSFTNVAKGQKAGATQTVVRGRFAGATVSGTVVEPALHDKGFDCAKFTGTWKAKRVTGTGDTTKAGAAYAKDDFSDPDSGFGVFNADDSYGEYLQDGRFRIGTRHPASAVSFRETPVTATADITVTTGFTSGSGSDGAGLACLGTGPTSFVAGFVGLDGTAGLLRYADNQVAEQAPDRKVPDGLLKTGDQAQNDLRMTCSTSPDDPNRTDVHLFLNGKEVASASASIGGAGKVGLYVSGGSGASEFTFSKFEVRKPK